MVIRTGLTLIAWVVLMAGAGAQWLDAPTPGLPRLPDGRPNLAATVPRAPDGRPDLSGDWRRKEPGVPPRGVFHMDCRPT